MSELSGKTGLGRQALFAALLEPALRKKAALPRRPFKPYQAGRPCRKRLNPPRPATITRP
jgi:hypothetical protein